MEGGRSLTLTEPTNHGSPWARQLAARWRARPTWDSLFKRTDNGGGRILAGIGWRTILVEWSFIFVLVLVYCLSFLSLGTQRMLPGPESEKFQSLDILLVKSLADYGQFPLWNPWLHSGVPAVGDPFIHIYNPLCTIPELLVGVRDGFKIGVFLSFVSGGLGMWWLGAVLGVGRMTRLWMALMYAFTGQPAARFFQGEYDFTLGAAWIPWFLASALAALRTRRRLHVVMASASAVMIFFSGNSQYSYYLLFVTAVLGGATIISLCRRMPFVTFDWGRAKVLVAIAVLAAGLAAVGLLPLLEFYTGISKATDPAAVSSHTIQQILLDYTSSDASRPDTWKIMPDGGRIPLVPREEYYDYTGIAPFLALLLLPLAYRRDRRRTLLFFFLILALVVAFIDITQMPWADLYRQNYILHQFRYHQRILIYGTCALLALAGLGIDAAARLLGKHSGFSGNAIKWGVRPLAASIGIGLLAVFVVWSVSGVYSVNRKILDTEDRDPAINNILTWLRGYDPGEYYTSYPGDSYYAFFSNRMRFYDAHYEVTYVRPLQGQLNRRPVEARPKYQILANDRRPDNRDAVPVRQFEKHTVYQLPHSLPFAFLVRNETLLDPAGGRELQAEDVSPVTPYIPGPNGVEVIAQAESGSMLVVLQTLAPGWRATVDGKPREMKNVGGYLALDLEPGPHRYVFTFGSAGFAAGLMVSVLSLLAMLALVASDLRVDRRRLLANLCALPGSLAASARLHLKPLLAGMAMARRGPPIGRTTIEAVHREGALRPMVPPEPPDGSPLRITLEPADAAPSWVRGVEWRMWWLGLQAGKLAAAVPLEWAFFGIAMLVYAVTRFWALDQFPIYFFCDEASEALYAQDLLNRGFRDGQGGWFPLFFEPAGQRWVPLFSVYVHTLTVGLFGKSIMVTRATSAGVTLFAATAVALILKETFKARLWWAGALFMVITPAWFLNGRTAFEWPIMITFYAGFLLFYLLYRTRNPNYLFPAVLAAAAAFYTYNTQAIMALLVLLLLLSDLRYHLAQRRTVLGAFALGLLLAVPLVGYRVTHPTAIEDQLRAIGSYWFQSIPIQQKIARYAELYLYGISPQYWFFPNGHDLSRHVMKGLANMRTETLPLWLVGVGLCLWRIRSAPHRAIVLAILAVPAAAATVDVGISRVLAFVVPSSIVMVLGLEVLLDRLPQRVSGWLPATATLVVLSWTGLGVLNLSLSEGPLWYRDYGLYGMQYGAKQLFTEAIPDYLRDPNVRLVVSHTWANAPDRFVQFFLSEAQRQRVQLDTVDHYMAAKLDLNPNTVFVMTAPEYEKARTSPKFKSVNVEKVLPYPDGTPGFYFARLAYSDNVDSVLAAEREARRQLVEGQVTIDGQAVTVRYSRLDMGQLRDMFDGDRYTLARGLEANPLVVEIQFPQPRPVSALAADFGSMDFSLTVRLYAQGSDQPVSYSATYRKLPPDPHVEMGFDRGPQMVSRMRLEIQDLGAGDTSHIHVRELKLQ